MLRIRQGKEQACLCLTARGLAHGRKTRVGNATGRAGSAAHAMDAAELPSSPPGMSMFGWRQTPAASHAEWYNFATPLQYGSPGPRGLSSLGRKVHPTATMQTTNSPAPVAA